MNRKLFFSFAISIAILPTFSAHGMSSDDELSFSGNEFFPSGEWTGDDLFSSDESSDSRFRVIGSRRSPFDDSDRSQNEESSEVSSKSDDQSFLLQMLLDHRSKIENFNMPESMKEIIVQLPTQDKLEGKFDFNFATNGGRDFCKQLYAQELTIAQALALIAQATQKDYERVIQGEMKESLAIMKRGNLEERLLKSVFQNHQEVLDELNQQYEENELIHHNQILCNFAKRYQVHVTDHSQASSLDS